MRHKCFTRIYITGWGGPRIFLRRGWTTKEWCNWVVVVVVVSEYQLYYKATCHLGGGGCTPLHPPPRSTSASLVKFIWNYVHNLSGYIFSIFSLVGYQWHHFSLSTTVCINCQFVGIKTRKLHGGLKICILLYINILHNHCQAFSQELKSGNPKCAIGPAQMKNQTIFLKKWPSTGPLDTHSAKSLLAPHS